ncbi:bile acid:sodium symporter family protein [Natronolimnobius baerhuensis]|uniref:Sodium symporter n=1 Tax=Natronolimnobius baerhuensis TaxID=253108 RepID=A0A202E3V2_9EURY|nr:bile acid:sodium symporter [Natronolimnobius baerhuensis]OVE82884.1 sodium symporter [Natronolimnobius baerhuensis]
MLEGPVGTAIDLLTAVFVLATMLSTGLGVPVSRLVASLEQRWLVVRSLLSNLVLVPLLAVVLIAVVPMDSSYAIGLLLVAIAPGAPFGPKLAEISRSNIAFASGLMVLLCLVSVVTIPLSMALLIPDGAAVDPMTVAQVVIIAQLAPLLVGLGIRRRFRSVATRLLEPMRRLSTYSMLLLTVLLVPATASEFVSLLGTGVLSVSVAVVVGSIALGYALGGPAVGTREALATTTAARNIAIALLVATTTFADTRVLAVTLVFGTVGLVVSVVTAGIWRTDDPQ